MPNVNEVLVFVDKSLSLPARATYTAEDHAGLILEAAKHNTYMETAKPANSVDPDTSHIYIANSTINRLHGNFQEMTTRHMRRMMKKHGILIFDITYEPFFGHTENDYVHEYRPANGCRGCFQFLAASIIVDGIRYFLYSVPLRKNVKDEDLVVEMRKVLCMLASLEIRIGICLLDRGFARCSKVIELLNGQRIPYLGLFPKYRNVRGIIKEMKGGIARMPFDVKGVSTTLVIIKTEKCTWTFVTSVEPRRFWRYIGVYKKRWNIETGFRVQDEARIRTKSTDVVVRYFLFLVSMILYNAWKILGITVQFKRFVIRFPEFCGNVAGRVAERLGVP